MQVLQTPRFFSRYRVDEDGRLYTVSELQDGTIKLKQLRNQVGKSGYIYNRIYDDAGNRVTV